MNNNCNKIPLIPYECTEAQISVVNLLTDFSGFCIPSPYHLCCFLSLQCHTPFFPHEIKCQTLTGVVDPMKSKRNGSKANQKQQGNAAGGCYTE